MVVAVVDWFLGGETAPAPDFCGDLNPVASAKKPKEETRRTRRFGLPVNWPRMIQEAAANCGRMHPARARARDIKNMPAWPYLTLLVVTLRRAWFNFHGCNKRP
jgi:hypothetical protein